MNNPYVYAPYTDVAQKPNDLRQTLTKYTYHWPLFLLCILLALALAFLYIKQTNPVYLVKAKLLIQDDKNKESSDKEDALMQLAMSTGAKQIESEVEIIKSRPLIREVVNELQLWSTYAEDKPYKPRDLYETTPLRFKLIEDFGISSGHTFKIHINDEHNLTVTRPDGQTTLKASLSDIFKSSFGRWKLEPTSTFKSYIGKTITLTINNPEDAVTAYQGKINTVLNAKAPILDLSIKDEVPQRGIDVLSSLIATYKRFNIIDKNKETESTLKFIDERLSSLTGELTAVEKDVEGYKSSVGLTDVSSKSQFFLDNVQVNDARLNEVNIQLNVIRGIEAYIQSDAKSDTPPATIGITDPGLISLVEQLSALQIKKDRLLAITPENNPLFVPINQQIASLRNAIRDNVSSIKTSLINTRDQLNQINSRFEAGIRSMPSQERQYISIKRQQAIKENLYVYLLQKREEVALSYASTLTDARTVEQPYYGDPESQKKVPIIIALLMGFFIPMGIISGRSTLRNRVMTREDIAAVTAAPVVCELMEDRNRKGIVVFSRTAIGEQIRSLRTSLLRIGNAEHKGEVTMFTSSIAGEGKSFVASNISVSLAAMGKRTIILELDLRKPQISKVLNITPNKLGISDYLQGKASMEEIIVPSGQPNLFVMSSGATPFNPSELLESDRMEALIQNLRAQFDNIILDTPPLHLVTDGFIVARLCDVCLYLVRHNFTPKSELKFIEESYQSGQLPNMGLVFNGVNMDMRYGYSVDYGYYADQPTHRFWLAAAFKNFSARF